MFWQIYLQKTVFEVKYLCNVRSEMLIYKARNRLLCRDIKNNGINMKLTLKEIIQATNVKILKNKGLSLFDKFNFSTDTRTLKKGDIYLPLKGDNFDGENFIQQAIDAGAVGYFASGDAILPEAKLVLQVKDVLTTYLELAKFYKRKISPVTVAVTGSCGKTTTKEMIYCILSEKFKTHKTELNHNNEIGLCQTISTMPDDTQVLILEMGMRGLGEIELLSKYAEPDIAIITNVGTSHIGRLGSRENIAKAKCELIKYIKAKGLLIAHDDELIRKEVSEKVKELNLEDTNFYSLSPTLSYTYFSLNNAGVTERSQGYSKFIYKLYEYTIYVEGDYNIQNALPAIDVGLKMGMTQGEINKGLAKYSSIEKRWEICDVKGFKIINDSYNANPESMIAAIKTVVDLYPAPILFVLGDMGELGELEVEYHQEIGDFLVKHLSGDVNVITVGHLANEITQKLNNRGISSTNFENNEQASRYILDNVENGTTIVLKASRAMKFEEIVNELKRA